MGRYAHPRNKRLPVEAYCDPQRIVFFTIRAMARSSPFGIVRPDGRVNFNQPLCDLVLNVLYEAREDYDCDVLVVCLMPDHIHFWHVRALKERTC